MSSSASRSPSLAQRVRRRARHLLHSATERCVSLKWQGLRLFSPSTLRSLHNKRMGFFVDLLETTNLLDYKDLNVEDFARFVKEARLVTRDMRYHASTLARSNISARLTLASPAIVLASSYASIYAVEKRSGMTRKLRLLRQMITLLVETGLAICPPADIAHSDMASTENGTDAQCLNAYGESFREALKGGMPKVWLPLYKAFTVTKKPVPTRTLGETAADVEEVATQGLLTYLSEEALLFHTVPTFHRHLALFKKHLPHKIPLLASMCETEPRLTSALYNSLRSARTPRMYKACLTLWHTHGFPLDSAELWRKMRHAHAVPSAFACALHCAQINLNQMSSSLTRIPPPEGLTCANAVLSPLHEGEAFLKQEDLALANYVLPLLHEGEAFLKQAGVSLKDMKPLAPKGSPALTLLTKGKEGMWSPWQHLAAYLSLGICRYENTLPSLETLHTLLSLCEEAWGPPTTHQGTVEDFVTWHTTLLTLRPSQEAVLRQTDDIENAWRTYLDHQALKATLDAAPKTQGEAFSSLVPHRRRL